MWGSLQLMSISEHSIYMYTGFIGIKSLVPMILYFKLNSAKYTQRFLVPRQLSKKVGSVLTQRTIHVIEHVSLDASATSCFFHVAFQILRGVGEVLGSMSIQQCHDFLLFELTKFIFRKRNGPKIFDEFPFALLVSPMDVKKSMISTFWMDTIYHGL